jgi:hypothetical protein
MHDARKRRAQLLKKKVVVTESAVVRDRIDREYAARKKAPRYGSAGWSENS